MGKALAYILGFAVVVYIINLIASLCIYLWDHFAWAMIYGPLLAIVGIVALTQAISAFSERKERQALKRAGNKRRIAELEAAQGIPVLTDGECPDCGAQLLADAKYCSQCRATLADTLPEARICDNCQTRNLDDAIYCGECGATLTGGVKIGAATSYAATRATTQAVGGGVSLKLPPTRRAARRPRGSTGKAGAGVATRVRAAQ